ncbi:hypothetical protein JB92DRAFT_1656419 [Gautieria morchelliformis]|nr:hypothetical protein JB92DRAFT_1656419 [Gautieria morchelliformis]
MLRPAGPSYRGDHCAEKIVFSVCKHPLVPTYMATVATVSGGRAQRAHMGGIPIRPKGVSISGKVEVESLAPLIYSTLFPFVSLMIIPASETIVQGEGKRFLSIPLPHSPQLPHQSSLRSAKAGPDSTTLPPTASSVHSSLRTRLAQTRQWHEHIYVYDQMPQTVPRCRKVDIAIDIYERNKTLSRHHMTRSWPQKPKHTLNFISSPLHHRHPVSRAGLSVGMPRLN